MEKLLTQELHYLLKAPARQRDYIKIQEEIKMSKGVRSGMQYQPNIPNLSQKYFQEDKLSHEGNGYRQGGAFRMTFFCPYTGRFAWSDQRLGSRPEEF